MRTPPHAPARRLPGPRAPPPLRRFRRSEASRGRHSAPPRAPAMRARVSAAPLHPQVQAKLLAALKRAEACPVRSVRILHRHHFSSALQRMSAVVELAAPGGGKECRCLVKGSPEAVVKLLATGETPRWYVPVYRELAGPPVGKCPPPGVDDSAPPARLLPPRAQPAPTRPGPPAGQLGGVPWSPRPASGRPKDGDAPISPSRRSVACACSRSRTSASRPRTRRGAAGRSGLGRRRRRG